MKRSGWAITKAMLLFCRVEPQVAMAEWSETKSGKVRNYKSVKQSAWSWKNGKKWE